MPNVRSGKHGNLVYVFEDQGFDASPNDTEFKIFGSNTQVDTWEGSHQAVRVFNADGYAADVIERTFDGALSISCNLSEPPWWLAGILGQPTASTITGSLEEFTYDNTSDNDPVSLRCYAPTDGFNDYEIIPGFVIASVEFNQQQPDLPDVTIQGAYAREPESSSSLSPSVPSFSEDTYSNRHGELQVDSTTVARVQNVQVSLAHNPDMITEFGGQNAVDFSPKVFEPSVTHEKITYVGESQDQLQRFRDGNQVAVNTIYDNGAAGEDQYRVDVEVQDSLANEWSEAGRNNPQEDLTEELTEMGETATVKVTTDSHDGSGNPPGITL